MSKQRIISKFRLRMLTHIVNFSSTSPSGGMTTSELERSFRFSKRRYLISGLSTLLERGMIVASHNLMIPTDAGKDFVAFGVAESGLKDHRTEGGLARAASLSAARRTEIATMGGLARWRR